jgi:hypothetical protein
MISNDPPNISESYQCLAKRNPYKLFTIHLALSYAFRFTVPVLIICLPKPVVANRKILATSGAGEPNVLPAFR